MALILQHPFRFLRRLGAFSVWAVRLFFHCIRLRKGGRFVAEDRQEWMRSNARRLAQILRLRIRLAGKVPEWGLIASNHLSYLDVVLIASVAPGIFVSKSEVRHWPVIGILSRWAGTLYLRRAHRSDLARIGREVAALLEVKERVVIFPEGTSTDGKRVLGFHSSLFWPAETIRSPTTPCFLKYGEPGNQPERRVCFQGTALFLPHFLNLLALEFIEAEVVFGEPIAGAASRKQLARAAHASVCQMAAASQAVQQHASKNAEPFAAKHFSRSASAKRRQESAARQKRVADFSIDDNAQTAKKYKKTKAD